MATTAGSILGNFAPAMQEPYQIETPLAQDAIRGDPRANSMLNSYWLERQMREGDYASRLADQMAFGRQYLQEQQAETALKAMPDITKNNLLPATRGILTGLLPGLDTSGLDYATQQAAQTTAATNLGAAGRGAGAMGQVGLNIPPAQLAQVTGIQGITQGPSVPERAQAVANQGRVAAASIGAANRNQPKETDVYIPGATDPQRSITYPLRGGTGYNLPIPPVGGGGGGGGGPPPPQVRPAGPASATVTPNQPVRPPPSFSKVTDAGIVQGAQNAVDAAKAARPDIHKDVTAGFVGNKPVVVTDGKGGYYAVGKSGTAYPLNAPQKTQ